MSIKIEKVQVVGWEPAIRGMRNPLESHDKSNSGYCYEFDCLDCPYYERNNNNDGILNVRCNNNYYEMLGEYGYIIGPNDLDLMKRLCKAGSDDRKFMRMIVVYADITAPLYWWKEYDTYRIGTVANSCSTMHKIHAKEFNLDDFSHEHLDIRTIEKIKDMAETLNDYRNLYNNYDPNDFEVIGCPSKKDIWWQMIQILPTSYNQKRTVMLNYEVLANIYHARKNHKLDEWREFCKLIENELPYSELITEYCKREKPAKVTKEMIEKAITEMSLDDIYRIKGITGDFEDDLK